MNFSLLFCSLKKTFQSFLTTEAISSFVLLFFTGLALFLANSQWQGLYESLINFPVSLHIGAYSIQTNIHHIVNEALMALFFFVVGMEVKREFLEGELSSRKKAVLPILAAIGGSLIPSLIFYYFNQGLVTEKGWGIPMATDIAFAVGVMSLLSHRVSPALKIFLLSIAIIDDIIAVLVIALFYSGSISGPFLAMVCISSFMIFLYFKLNLNNNFLFTVLALALWSCMYKSGIHSTLSGVLLGCLIPYKNLWSEKQTLNALKRTFSKKEQTSLLETQKLKNMIQDTKSVLQRMISAYHPFVSYIIMPLFAFTNAGIHLGGIDLASWLSHPVSYGVIFGLCIGKPIGITLFSYLSCASKLAERPAGVLWSHIVSVAFLAGIGFTMSLFIMNLCFDSSSSVFSYTKLSVLVASLISAVIGLVILILSPSSLSKLKKS